MNDKPTRNREEDLLDRADHERTERKDRKMEELWAKRNKQKTLPNDIARCDGEWIDDGDHSCWREGCETCLRRTAQRPEEVWMMSPPPIIAFECEFLIEPTQ